MQLPPSHIHHYETNFMDTVTFNAIIIYIPQEAG